MANFLHKLVKNKNASLSPVLLNSSNLHQITFLGKPSTSSLIPRHTERGAALLSLWPQIDGSSKLPQSQQLILPNSPFGWCFNPVSSSGFGILDRADSDDVGIIRADSVKKKRKRKMNKHKYKKLRKRLRRKAK